MCIRAGPMDAEFHREFNACMLDHTLRLVGEGLDSQVRPPRDGSRGLLSLLQRFTFLLLLSIDCVCSLLLTMFG